MQGNFISHPIPGGEVLSFLANNRRRENEMRLSQRGNSFVRPVLDS